MKNDIQQRTFNATPEGQRAMCTQAASDSVVLMANAKVRQMGGNAWADPALASMLASASPAQRDSIFADILNDYNALCGAR